MEPATRRGRTWPLVLLGWVCISMPLEVVPAAGTLEVSRDPGAVIVSYSESLGGVEHPDRGPALWLFGDGRLAVHFPVYMKRAGTWTTRLDETEIRGLLTTLIEAGALRFDAAALERTMASQAPVLRARSEPGSFVMELRLVRFGDVGPLLKRVSWTGLERDRARFPDLAPLADLERARSALRTLMQRTDLTRVEP